MIAATMLVGLCSVGASSAEAQTCYLVGHVEHRNSVYPGIETIYGWGETAISTGTSGWMANVPVACSASASRVEVWVPYKYTSSCPSGYQMDSTTCANDSPDYGAKWTAAETENTDYHSGFYGIWYVKGRFYHWTGYPPSTLSSPKFLISEPADYGDPAPWDECEEWEYWDDSQQRCIAYNTPILISLKSQRFKLTSADDGVDFDIDGDGDTDRVAWTLAGDDLAFLAYDANGDGQITSGKELFGNRTVDGAPNGFSALKKLAGGTPLTADNPFFNRLLLWTDTNHNGVSESNELRPFGDLFYEISLGYGRHNRKDGNGNLFAFRGSVLAKSNKPYKDIADDPEEHRAHARAIYDVILAVK
jgi:hypothetical protein